ncbi:MAG: HPr family phosphocarrier protein [Candidatus Omnitrophica bacterium]|nr:HPr family phosphocarrier protein [Candidatus Omnitrophota bacterium]
MNRLEKNVIVLNKKGLHARPAATFVQLVDKLNVAVTIERDQERINGKSIMGLLTLGAQCGTSLKIIVEGEESQSAMQQLEDFFSKQEEDYKS